MPVTSSSTPFEFTFSNASSFTDADAHLVMRYRQGDSTALLAFIHRHHRAIFRLTHGLTRNEVAAEKITQQVFSRVRRQLAGDRCPASVTAWLYYASLRFARLYHWKSIHDAARNRMIVISAENQLGLDLKTFVQVIARCQDKIEPRDCELLSLRHVLCLPLGSIAQLLHIHPDEVSKRLLWAREHFCDLSRQLFPSPIPETA